MAIVNLVSPWIDYYRKLDAFFGEDSRVNVIYDDDSKEVKLYVEGTAKASALSALLPGSISFGSVNLIISVIPANGESTGTYVEDLYGAALNGNPAVSYTEKSRILGGVTYIVFRKKVVQYYSDNIGDIHRMRSTLYQDLAREIFTEKTDGVFFCTDTADAPAGSSASVYHVGTITNSLR